MNRESSWPPKAKTKASVYRNTSEAAENKENTKNTEGGRDVLCVENLNFCFAKILN